MPRRHQPLPEPLRRKPVIGITMGEPGGIGPEVVVKALADPAVRRLARFVVYGMNELMAYAADLAELEPYWHRLQHDSPRAEFGLVHDVVVLDYDEYSLLTARDNGPSKLGGQASMRFLDDAIAAAHRPIDDAGIDALVTAPICKESWQLAGFRFPGHTELLQKRCKARRAAMMFHAPPPLPGTPPASNAVLEPVALADPQDAAVREDPPEPRPVLNVVLATIHVPLMDVRNLLTIGCVFDPIDLGHQAMQRLGIEHPRIAVCGLNPHAGENGLFGDEETRVITPAIQMAQQAGIDAHGPFPADTLFTPRVREKYDLIVAMYHDQGLIPVKMLAFDDAVNVTLGLPIIRTSVDHGTAFDRVGKNQAHPGSMKAAIRLAVQLASGQAASGQARAAI
ncbi:MAG: 4-hydroxythreonine-4-phosphate dehydrogenase PdxA [Planctomycetota bacterium]